MRNIALTLRYLGTAYHGWQVQKNDITVGQTLEKAAAMVVGHKVHITGCGRTDAGVHAKVYVANFRTDARIPVDRIPYAFNTHLPGDIVVTGAMEVHDGFNAIGGLAIAMAGVYAAAPVLSMVLGPIISPIYTAIGADASMFATTILACDMGGYPLAMELASDPSIGNFAGLILGTMMGPTIVFTIPVALGIIKKEPDYNALVDRRFVDALRQGK